MGRLSAPEGRRVLALVTDAYGGYGGIAAYNRDVIDVLCADERIAEVVAIPRSVPNSVGTLPNGLRFDRSGSRGIVGFVAATIRHAMFGGRFDLVYCAHVHLAPIAWLASKLTGAPWVLALYGAEAWKKAGRPIADRVAGRADRYLAISHVTLERFREIWPVDLARCAVVYNAVHLSEFCAGAKDPELQARYGLADKKVLMTLGRLDPTEQAKGFDRVISLLPRLRQKVPNIAYLICGAGGDQGRLETLATDNEVRDLVVFTGMIEESEKAAHYRLADLYVMPSRLEGFGFVFLEAMACGIPVIASSIDGGREAVRLGDMGQMVDPFDSEALEQAIYRGLEQARGVPDGLSYFSYGRFRERLLAALRPAMR